ncbi:MAG: hypothetical protein NTX29_14585, partial [Actinobacteria bacterium]|nr:hypothetical protein [Actinomycetota bacterium]
RLVVFRRPATLVLVTLIAVTVGVSSPGTAHARTRNPHLFWSWSDGVDDVRRTFDVDRYRTPDQLPQLIVATDPATAGRSVILQFEQAGTWRTDDRARTDNHGTAAVEFNPFCENGDWCERTYTYRLVVNGASTTFTITYTS